MSQPTQLKSVDLGIEKNTDHPKTPAPNPKPLAAKTSATQPLAINTLAAKTKAPVIPIYKIYTKDCTLLFSNALSPIVTSREVFRVPLRISLYFITFKSIDTIL